MAHACFFFDVHSCNGGDTMSLVGCPARISPLGKGSGGVFGLPVGGWRGVQAPFVNVPLAWRATI